jgi:hypothetical protein
LGQIIAEIIHSRLRLWNSSVICWDTPFKSKWMNQMKQNRIYDDSDEFRSRSTDATICKRINESWNMKAKFWERIWLRIMRMNMESYNSLPLSG